MKWLKEERGRYQSFIRSFTPSQWSLVGKAFLKTGFYLFSPYVIVSNLMVFYALYLGIGYWISLVLLSILVAGTFNMLDYFILPQRSQRPELTFMLYYGISVVLLVPAVLWGVL